MSACPRIFEAEAVRDGRIVGAERASFDRHVTMCSECSREVEALQRLAAPLRDTAGHPSDADELGVRRERIRLLAAFDKELLTSEPPRAGSRPLAWSATFAAIVAIFVVWRTWGVERPLHSSNIIVQADGTASWSRRSEGEHDVVILERGALRIQVVHGKGERPLRVMLPDGELEDKGTTFTVSVEGDRTTRVVVEEGSVVLRVRGRLPVTIIAGGRWFPSGEDADSSAASATPLVEPSRGSVEASPMTAPSLASAPSLPSTRPSSSPARPRAATRPAVEPQLDAAATEFRAAMSLLASGDYREAATRFARFSEDHPHDPRAEDAAYLRVLSLERSGDVHAMKEAAREYIRRYPSGFRRAEVERLPQ
ncbi:MAG TPA: FecR domain-containing protein [Labilithrix sp.]|nr:FecR domain-containing protein [Labilithrix sp.]